MLGMPRIIYQNNYRDIFNYVACELELQYNKVKYSNYFTLCR